MDRLEELEARLDELEEMHNQLGARFRAVSTVCRAVFPLIEIDPALLTRLAASSYDITQEQIEAEEMDEAYQKVVRTALDQLWGSMLKAAQTRRRAAPPDPS